MYKYLSSIRGKFVPSLYCLCSLGAHASVSKLQHKDIVGA